MGKTDERKKFMEKNINRKMTDAELSRKFGRYQIIESIGMLGGALCVIIASILAFVQHDLTVFAILFFGGVALILLAALPAQKKKKKLMHQQLGSYFRAELTRAFGTEPDVPELPIDESFLKTSGLLCIPWTECKVEDFHEGVHNELRFSAANVELSRTKEERSGPNNDNWMTSSETLFHGVVLRCRDICDPVLDITFNDQFHERIGGNTTDPSTFRQYFSASTSDGQPVDDLVTPSQRELVQKLEIFANNGKVCGLVLKNGSLTLALNTGYVFANIPDVLDMRDIDGIRKWFTASLTGMGRLLDLIREDPSMTIADRWA